MPRAKKLALVVSVCGLLASLMVSAAETVSTSCAPVMTPIMVNGDRTHADVASRVAVLGFDYDERGTATPPSTQLELATAAEVGTTWGTAYNSVTKKYYVSAFLRRHADISPGGLGAIYEIDVSDVSDSASIGEPVLWMDLNSATHLGAGATLFPSETAANRGLTGPNDPSRDIWAYEKVGRHGLAGLELSDDGTTLYAVDMTNRQLLVIDVASKSVSARYPITDPGCAGGAGDVRPFGVDYLNGEVYVGVTCSGETNQSDSEVNSYVSKLDGGGFTPVVSDVLQKSDISWLITYWQDDPMFGAACDGNNNAPSKSTPIITNMELDENGNMLIGVSSIHGFRFGWANYYPTDTCNDLDDWTNFGYLIRATPSASGWTRESDPTDENTGFFGWGVNNGDGHNRSYIGGLAVTDCSGQEVAIANIQDPISPVKGGVRFVRTADGQQEAATNNGDTDTDTRTNSSKRLYGVEWGKSSGLGDIEYLHPAPALEVDVQLSKTVSPKSAKSGDTVVYTLTVTNAGPDAATGVVVTDKLPDGLIFVSHDGASPGVYDAETGEWNVGTVEVGAANAVILQITATVK
ncbi:DUF11 domain-containing protein [Thiothrix nivea]|nr:DUF11 domain-containing protein [Thiothrix nivea]